MSNVVQQGSLGGITWPLHQDGKPITTVDRTSRNDILSAVEPAVLLPSPQPLDYQLWAKHELPTQYTPLPLLEQQLSFFARHLGHEGPIPAELLQELLLEHLEGPAAAAATAARGNRLAALQVQLPTHCSTPPPPAANTLQQQQQQGPAQAGAASKAGVPSTGYGMSSCGHAGSAVLVLSVAGNASQQLVLTVLQHGDLPTHLNTQPPASNAAARASGILQDSHGAGGCTPLAPAAAAAAAGSGDAGQQEEASCVQLSAAVPAVLDLGSTVEEVGLRHLPPAVTACWQDAMAAAHASTPAAGAGAGPEAAAAAAGQQAPPGRQTDAVAGGQAGSGQQQQHQQPTHQQGPPAMPVALVWARCSSKVYAALVTYTAPAPATATARAIPGSHQQKPEQQQQHSTEGDLQQQQSQRQGQAVQSGLLASSGWRLVLLGVAALPVPLLAAEWHPLLPQAVLGCSDGSIWLVTVPEDLLAQAMGLQQQQQQQQAWPRQQGPPVCLHPDDRLPRLLLQPQGTLGWFTAAAQRAAAAAAAAASTAAGGGGGVAPLLLATGAHPRQLLAACGGTLMRHDLSPADSTTRAQQQQQQQQDGQAASSLAAAAATAAGAGASKLPGKLLLQLPDSEVICALATWPGAQCHWQQAAAAEPAAAAAAAAGMGQSAVCVHVRHLLAVATSRQLMLLDLRKSASEPLIIWQHAVDSSGTPSSHPSLLQLLPAPPSEAVAAASCSKDCFEGRPAASAAAPSSAAGAAAETTAAAGDGQLTAAAAGAATGAEGTGVHAACGAASLDRAAVQPPSSSRAGDEAVPRVPQALQGFDPRLYPSQMFQLGSESQGAAAALGDVPLFNTQASQFGDAAAWDLHGPHLQQQQQHGAGVKDGMQQQQLSGDRGPSGAAAATREDALSPAAAAAAVARRVAGPSATAAGSSSSDTRGPGVPSSELRGVIVWGSRGSGDICTVNFRLQWAAGLAPTPLPLHQAVGSLSARLRGLSTNTAPPAAAAAGPAGTLNVLPAAAAAGGVSSNQQVPGAAALGFITKAMQTLSMSAIAGAAESAVDRSRQDDRTDLDRRKVRTGEGNGPSAPAASGVRNVSCHSFQRSPLGAWQLPSVVQVTTPGPGQLLARPVSESVRSERVRELRLSRAAAAAARGDARSASEVGLLPGAALDISKSAVAQPTLKLMAAAPDTQGIALCSIPWCWSGGLARALLLRSTADGDLSLQLCTTQHISLAVTGQDEAAEQQQQQQQGQRRQFKVGAAATAAANGTSGLVAALTEEAVGGREQLLQQQQWGRKPVLEVVTAVGSSGWPFPGASGTAASQQQQQQLDSIGVPTGQQQPAASLASQATVLQPLPQPLPQLQLQEGSAQPCVRSFEALQSWLDLQVDPPQLATAAAAARLTRLNYDQKRYEQVHAERQLVQLPAHTGLVITLTQQQQQGRQEPQQQQQQEQQGPDLNGSREQQSQQQQQQPSTISTGPQCRWPDCHRGQPPGATLSHQASMHLIPHHTLLQFGPPGSSTQPMSAAADSSTAAAAAAEHDGLQQQEEQQQQRMLSRPTAAEVVSVLSGQQLPLTLLELHYHLMLLKQQQQQQQEQGQRAGSSSSRKRRASAALNDPPEEHRHEQQQQQQQQGSNAAAGSSRVLRSSSRAAGRHGPSGPTAAAVAGARRDPGTAQPQQQQQHGGRVTRAAAAAAEADAAAAAAAASGHVDDAVHQQLSHVDVAKLLQHQLPEPQLQLAAWVLAAQHSTAAAPEQQQQQQQQDVEQSLTGAAAVATGAGVTGRQSPVLSNHVLVDGGRVAALYTQLDKLLCQQQQQDIDDDSTASRLQGYQLRPLTISSTADIMGHDDADQQQQLLLPTAADTPASQNHQPAAAAAAVAAGGAHADESGMRYVVQPVGPGVWDAQGAQGLELAGPSAALARAGGAAAAVVREVSTTNRSHQPQQQQQQQCQSSQQQQQGVRAAGGVGGVVPPSTSSSFARLAGTVGGAAGNGAAVDLFATQAGPEPDADPAAAGGGAGGGGGSISSKAVSAEFAPFGTLLQHSTAAQQLLDVTPRLISHHQQQQQAAADASGTAAAAAAAAAAAGSMLAAGRVSRSAAVTPAAAAAAAGAAGGGGQAVMRAPPGLLALAMSQEAQQRWLLLQDEWTLPGDQQPLSDAGEPVRPPSTHTRTAAAAGESAGLQRQVQARYQHKQQGQGMSVQPAKPTTTQQQQRQQRWPELLDSRTSVPSVGPAAAAAAAATQHQQQQRGSALLAALGAQQRPAPPVGRRQQHIQVHQQQQQQQAPLLLRDKQPLLAEGSQHLQQQGITGQGQHSTQQQQQQQQQRIVQSQQQQQQQPVPQQSRQGPLLLSQPSQQRQMMLLHQQQPHWQQQQQGPLPSHPSQQQQQQPPRQQGSLLSRLTQQQQQQPGRPSSARGRSSLLMPSNRRR